ncbi:MAG: phosphotransferase family protein [Deltaproteobacteria bacterium]|nr:phosphotransferase family protein [Deltaproteobacteria bacterium]
MAEAARAPSLEELAQRATAAVQARFARARVGGVTPLLGGTSSLTYSAELQHASGDRRVVIKVAPPGVPPVRNRDVLRQARVLHALVGARGVAAPEVLGEDAGAPVAIPPLFVMSFVPGESYEPCLTSAEPSATRAQLEARYFAAAPMLAALHAVAPSDARIASEPVQDLASELARWQKAFASCEDDLRANENEVHAALASALPEEAPARILHGDYRLGNMQCEGERIGALIDWEIWSLGDPRLDLAWFLWNSNPAHPSCSRANAPAPAQAALVAAYEEATGSRARDLGWFGALVRYKQAAASALIAKNTRKLAKPGVDAARTAALIPRLLESALKELGK